VIARAKRWWRERVAPTLPARVFSRYGRERMSDHAAALTYYAMLSLFPALLFGVSLAGLLGGQSLIDEAVSAAESAGLDAEAQEVVRDAAETALGGSGEALGLSLVISLVLALSGASGVIKAAGRALDTVFGSLERDARGAIAQRARAAALTAVLALLVLAELAAALLGGDLATDAFDEVGLGEQAAGVWSFLRWPVALAAASVAVALVFRFAPSSDVGRARLLTPGAITVVALWVLLTALFGFYLRHFGDYGAVYGAFASAVVLLIWLNLMATAFLLGAELDAEIEDPAAAAPASAAPASADPPGN
jgi:membrane protein